MYYSLYYGLNNTGLPIILVDIKGKNLCFILDTGSTCSLIDSTVVEYFKDIVEPVGDYCISGIEGTKHKVDMITLPFNFEGQVSNSLTQYNTTMPNPEPNKWAGILLIAGTALLIIIMVILTIIASSHM